MSDDRFARYGAASGILAVLLTAGAFVGFILPNAPDLDAPGTDWATYFTDHQSRIQVGVIVLGVGLFFFIWFLGSVRSGLARAEGVPGRLASIAFGGGLVAAATLVIVVSLTAAAAYRPDAVSAELTRALNDTALLAAGPAAAGFVAFFAATALVAFRSALGAALGAICAIAAVGQAFAYFVIFTKSGAFAPDGALGLFAPVVTFGVGVIAISVVLMRQAGAAEAG